MDWLREISTPNMLVIGFVVLSIATMIFIVVMKRGIKGKFAGQTVEVPGTDGLLQRADSQGLNYILNDACSVIDERKKMTLDKIIPDLSRQIRKISNMTCVSLEATNILNARRRANGFEDLTSPKLYRAYVTDVFEELHGKTKTETERVSYCTDKKAIDVDEVLIKDITDVFCLKSVQACVTAYREKIAMYTQFKPQFLLLRDGTRASFCDAKIKKHQDHVAKLETVIASAENWMEG